MDGVLIDSEPMWKIAMEEVFLKIGLNLTRKDFQKTVGMRIDEVIHYWFQLLNYNGYSEKETENMIVQKMVELIEENGEPLPGVIDSLHFFRETGKKIGLATSSYTILIEIVLKKLNINDLFDYTYSAEHEKYGKPHPAVYLKVANKLGVFPKKCLVIEDSLNGVISGKAAGMTVICIPEKTHEPNPKLIVADVQFDDMEEMLTFFRTK